MGKRLVFPAIDQTTLRPDIVLWSKTGKKLIAIKLTVLWVARCEEAYERREQSTQNPWTCAGKEAGVLGCSRLK